MRPSVPRCPAALGDAAGWSGPCRTLGGRPRATLTLPRSGCGSRRLEGPGQPCSASPLLPQWRGGVSTACGLGGVLLDSPADMLLDLSDLLQVDHTLPAGIRAVWSHGFEGRGREGVFFAGRQWTRATVLSWPMARSQNPWKGQGGLCPRLGRFFKRKKRGSLHTF